VTLLDFERIALEVPGTHIARARAWAGIDPTYPCLKAPGTVTVVIVPALPSGRPEPSPALLEVTRRYLDRQRVIGTRLVVLGPTYLTVTVQARVRAKSQTNLIRVLNEIISGLDTFLDPLRGGPNGRGWPFGRDVYRAEILQVIDNVSGVDHVLELELAADNGEAQCANLCVGPTWLVTPGLHQIEVV
jgi:predicted phage baseplate assembly protein